MKNIFLVDADDTILDFHASAFAAIEYAFVKNGVEWKEEYVAEYIKINDGLWSALERKELTRETLMEQRFPIFLKHIGYDNVDGAACNRAYIDYLSTHPVYMDGAEDFLKELRKMGKIYIVTNGTSYIQESRFSICRLNEYVDGIFISEYVGCDKPATAFSEYVYARIPQFDKNRAIWIGDSLSADIRCANNSFVDSIWLNPKEKPLTNVAKPDYVAKNFGEILKILKGISK